MKANPEQEKRWLHLSEIFSSWISESKKIASDALASCPELSDELLLMVVTIYEFQAVDQLFRIKCWSPELANSIKRPYLYQPPEDLPERPSKEWWDEFLRALEMIQGIGSDPNLLTGAYIFSHDFHSVCSLALYKHSKDILIGEVTKRLNRLRFIPAYLIVEQKNDQVGLESMLKVLDSQVRAWCREMRVPVPPIFQLYPKGFSHEEQQETESKKYLSLIEYRDRVMKRSPFPGLKESVCREKRAYSNDLKKEQPPFNPYWETVAPAMMHHWSLFLGSIIMPSFWMEKAPLKVYDQLKDKREKELDDKYQYRLDLKNEEEGRIYWLKGFSELREMPMEKENENIPAPEQDYPLTQQRAEEVSTLMSEILKEVRAETREGINKAFGFITEEGKTQIQAVKDAEIPLRTWQHWLKIIRDRLEIERKKGTFDLS